MTEHEFSELCTMIQAAYPRDTFLETQEQFDLWWEMFKGFQVGFAKIAVKNYIREGKYLPSVSDITTRYNAVKADALQKKAHLKDIYGMIRDFYPQMYRGEGDTESEYWGLIQSHSYGECQRKADRIRSHVVEYVRYMEQNGGNWATLSECMREALA